MLVDEVFSQGAGGQAVSDEVLWLLADHQGTIRDIVDDSGTLRKQIGYDSFGTIQGATYYDEAGQVIEGTQPWTNPEAVDQFFFYTGQEWDADTQLQNNNARWYDPRTGRFLSEDPSAFDAGDPNLYRYVGNSPLNGTDPTGRFTQTPLNYLPALNVPSTTYAAGIPSDFNDFFSENAFRNMLTSGRYTTVEEAAAYMREQRLPLRSDEIYGPRRVVRTEVIEGIHVGDVTRDLFNSLANFTEHSNR